MPQRVSNLGCKEDAGHGAMSRVYVALAAIAIGAEALANLTTVEILGRTEIGLSGPADVATHPASGEV